MKWYILIIWFYGGELDLLQVGLPFPSVEDCGLAIPQVERIYANMKIDATYHCVPAMPEEDRR